MTDSNLADLDPRLLVLYRQWLDLCHAAGLRARATITWRSGADQDAAQAAGLSKACHGQSPHNCVDEQGLPASKAFDFGIFNADGSLERKGADPRYRQAGEIAESIGLVCGMRWKKPDYDHIELANWKTLT